MDLLSFIASLVKSLAWPGVVIFLLWYFKQPVGELLLSVSRLRYKEFEINFGKGIREVKETAAQTLPPAAEARARIAPEADRFLDLAKIDPSAAVLAAWKRVEGAVRRAAQRNQLAPPWPTLGVIRSLMLEERIDNRTYEIFNELRRLRNQAAHEDGADITQSEALDFADLAIRLAAKIDEA